jgi:hypothetical protein
MAQQSQRPSPSHWPSHSAEPAVFRACLRLVAHEAELSSSLGVGSGRLSGADDYTGKNDHSDVDHERARNINVSSRNDDVCALIKKFCVEFSTNATAADQVRVTPHILSAVATIIARNIHVESCAVVNENQLLASLECFNLVMTKATEDVVSLEAHISQIDSLINSLKRLVPLSILCFECLRKLLSSSSSTATSADIEESLLQCFQGVENVVLLFKYCKMLKNPTLAESEMAEYVHVVQLLEAKIKGESLLKIPVESIRACIRGPIAAQVLQTCLQFAMHPSKRIAASALKCLYIIQVYLEDTHEWRNYIPGVFTALHNLCLSGYKRSVG